jgi:hypothetical protein
MAAIGGNGGISQLPVTVKRERGTYRLGGLFESCGHAAGMRGFDSGSCDRSSLFRPDRDGAVGTAILAGSFEGEAHMLT